VRMRTRERTRERAEQSDSNPDASEHECYRVGGPAKARIRPRAILSERRRNHAFPRLPAGGDSLLGCQRGHKGPTVTAMSVEVSDAAEGD
jgi:hypothetical protein